MRDERTVAERAVEVEAKGFLTNDEMYDWMRPYNLCLSDGLLKKHPKIKWSKNAEYHLDGRIRYNRRWVGRWVIEVDTRMRAFGSRLGEEKGWRVHPHRAFDPVYLFLLRQRMHRFNNDVLWTRYQRAADALYKLHPDGATLKCNPSPSEDGQEIYYQTVRVPSARERERGEHGLSFGSGSSTVEEAEHPLEILGAQKVLWDVEDLIERHGDLASAANHAFSRRSRFRSSEGVVTAMLFNAITRHLPHGWGYGRHEAGPIIEFRILNTVYYFRRLPSIRSGGSAGWDNIMTLADDDKSMLKFNFQVEGKSSPAPPSALVTASEIARRVGKSRQAVQLWADGKRCKTVPFPGPVMIDRRTRVWRWADVLVWVKESNIQMQGVRT
jgi:hypothetical protein